MAELDHLRALAIEDRRSERPPIVLDNPPSAPVRRNSSKRLSFNGVSRFKSAAKVVQRQLSSIQTFGSPPPVHPYHTTPTSQYTPPPLTAPIEFGEISLTKNATHFPRLPSWHPEAHAVARLSIHSKVASAPSPPPRRRSMAAELPHLVLVNIFLHCRDINPLSPWIVSGVSRRWRIASLAPGLWSRIHLTSALQRPTRTTETWIDRSKNVPYLAVSFNVFESEDNWGRNWSQTIVDDLFQLVWRQLPRIREFEFVTNLQGYTAIAGEWLRGHAPVLQTLRVAYQPRRESPRENMQRQNIPLLIPQTNILQPNIPLALGAPRLLNVTFDAAYIAWSPQLLWGLKRLSLSTCEGHTDIVLLSDILANCPELVSLSLSLPHIHQVAMIPRVTLPRLQEFQVCGTGNVYLALQCIDAPRLKTLIVSDVDGLTLLPSLEGAPRLPLSTLRALVLRNVHNIPSDFMTRLGGFPRLKDLTIDGSSFRSSTRFLDEMGTRRADPSDAMLPKLAVLLFENVPWVDVHDVQRLLQRRASWTRLRRIDVSRCHAFEGPDRKFVAAGPPLQSRLMRASTLPAAPPPPKY